MSATANTQDEFRDHISTVDQKGKRIWVFPKKPKGKLTTWRSVVSYVLLAFLFAGPFMRINGNPVLQINVLEREFFLLGNLFRPEDFILFAVGMITSIVFVILFTLAFGRLFCGWVCPQTIFMEKVFRRIEYWIEGDWNKQKALARMPWNREKILKKSSKHTIFFVISFLIANTFLAYIIGSEALIEIITDPPKEHLAGLGSLLLFTSIFYGVFSWFREQVCTTVCPYGRLQGVLLDKDSIVVAYDHKRGESRGKFRKKENRLEAGKGDCIDCKLCVNVCPTGIDIRNGTQLECVNCTACIDACNEMMDKVNLKRGLIRYASDSEIAEGRPFRFTTKMIAYSVVLLLLMGTLTSMMVLRSEVQTTVLRAPGMLYQQRENGRLSNLYTFKVVNKTADAKDLEFRIEGFPEAEIEMVGQEIDLEAHGIAEGSMFVYLPRTQLTEMKTQLIIGVYQGEQRIDRIKTNFLGPIPELN